MSDDFYDNLTAESFGVGEAPQQPQPVTPKKRNTNRIILFGCLGCMMLCLLCCCIWVGASFLILQNPSGIVQSWGAVGTFGLWDFGESYVCENSQAVEVTDTLNSQNARFSEFNVLSSEGNVVQAEGVLEIGGTESPWRATFTLLDEGPLGKCISEIDVGESSF